MITIEAILLVGLVQVWFEDWLIAETTLPGWLKVLALMVIMIGILGFLLVSIEQFTKRSLVHAHDVVKVVSFPWSKVLCACYRVSRFILSVRVNLRYPMATIIRLIVAILLALSLLPWAFYLTVDALRLEDTWFPQEDRLGILIGACCGIAFVLWKRPNAFIHTFVHEACHAILCLSLGVRVTSFRVTNGDGGAVGHTSVDPFRGTIISIAPYTLPLLLGICLGFRMWFDEPTTTRHVLSALCAFFFVHHLQALYYNIRINMWGKQADLVKVGRPLSAILIATALCFTTFWTIKVFW